MTIAGHPARGGFSFLYPLAFLGAHLAFMPLLVLLLPRRVATLAPDSTTATLSLLLLVGGVTASLAHIAAGGWSDGLMARTGSRRGAVAAGLALLLPSYAALALAPTVVTLGAAVVAFQVALNIMFAPLGALLADYVPDAVKARTSAWLALALPLSIFAGAPIARLWPDDSDLAFAAVAATIALSVLPLLLAWPARAMPSSEPTAAPLEDTPRPMPARDFALAWAARLLVQCGATLVINYLFLYLGGIERDAGVPVPVADALATLLMLAALVGAGATLVAGLWSDRLRRRRRPMIASALMAAGGLLVLAVAPPWPLIIASYCLFSAGLTIFLALDSALVATLVGQHPARGRWLGVMNLTNTLPAVLTPALALGAIEVSRTHDLSLLLGAAALAAMVAAALIGRIRTVS